MIKANALLDYIFVTAMALILVVLLIMAAPMIYQTIANFPNYPAALCTKS